MSEMSGEVSDRWSRKSSGLGFDPYMPTGDPFGYGNEATLSFVPGSGGDGYREVLERYDDVASTHHDVVAFAKPLDFDFGGQPDRRFVTLNGGSEFMCGILTEHGQLETTPPIDGVEVPYDGEDTYARMTQRLAQQLGHVPVCQQDTISRNAWQRVIARMMPAPAPEHGD